MTGSKQADGFATAPQGNVTPTSHRYVTTQSLTSSNVTKTAELRGGGLA
jgi:hypothetical protein